MSSFLNDLAIWEQYQLNIVELLNLHFRTKNNYYSINSIKKDIDIISSQWSNSIEVKYDRQAHRTWNIFIEYECRWKVSWVFKYSSMDVFIYGTNEQIFFFKAFDIKKFILLSIHWHIEWIRKVNGWDWWASKGILIPISMLDTIIFRKLNIKLWVT